MALAQRPESHNPNSRPDRVVLRIYYEAFGCEVSEAGQFRPAELRIFRSAADYHTHPLVEGYDSERFSPQDMAGNRKENMPGYLGTPTRILKYNPTTNTVKILERIH